MKEKDRSPVRKRSRLPDDGKDRRGSLASRRSGELLTVASNNCNSYVPCGASSRRSLPGDKRDNYLDIRTGNGYEYGGAVLASRSDPRSPESEYKTLKISELGSQLNDEDIEDGLFHEFKKFGNVSVKMSRENDERVAFVNFRKPDDARAAKHARGRLVLFDRPLKVDVVYMNRRRSRSPLSKDNFPPGHRHVPPQRSLSPTSLGYRDFRLQQMALGPLPPPPLPHLTDVERDAYYSLYDARNHAAFLPEFHNDNLSEDDQRANRTLFLGNLDIVLTESDLRRTFDRFGAITEVAIKRAGRDQNSAFGFVKFENLDMARRAKAAMSGKVLGHNQIKIGYGKPTPTTRLWVGGLGSWISLAALAKEFDRFGTIRTIDYRKGDAWAYVQYESLDAAQAACTHMRGFPLGGPNRRLRVDFADTEHHYNQQQQYAQPPLPLPHYDLVPPPFDHRFADSMRARSPLLPPPRFRERDLSSPAEWSGLGVHERMRGSGFPPVAHLERHSREHWPVEREWELQRGAASRRKRPLEHGWRPDRSPDNNDAPRNGSPAEHSPADGGGDSDSEHLPRPGRPSPTRGHPNIQDRRRRALSPTAPPSHSERAAASCFDRERKRKPGDKPKSPAGKEDISEHPSTQKLSQVWRGVLLLKNSSFPTVLHLLDGDTAVVSRLLLEGSKGGQASQLKISQRLRMDRPKLDEVSRRIKAAGPSGYSVLLAMPGNSEDATAPEGKDSTERPLKNLVSYLKQKEAAGIVSLPVGGTRDKEHSGVLHAFPPCEFSLQFMDESAKAFAKSDDDYMVMVIIRGAS
ncbi:RNA-binding protein 15-like [Phyllopteryx taeniolatus]|uniref:RNA-binding protein 15-like n=1 Tax=Phyllopteryx taeniolatus TaxID=161469 RepID=UPI002AD3BFD4|nr:RNA-binding protein 15-like [Phyllopteryx taeniolatus]